MNCLYTYSKYSLFLLVLSWMGTSCKKKDSGPVPTYVHVDSFSFNAQSAPTRVATSHQITAVWAYYNNNPVGVFDLPADIPVITDGTSGQLTLRPAVAMSGLNNFMVQYPFYTSDISTLTSQPGKTVNYIPTTTFASAARFQIISTFDSSTGPRFVAVDGSVPLKVSVGENGSIALSMPVDTMSEDSSSTRFMIDQGKEAFIEFDYKNTIPFAVGLRANIAGSIYFKYYLGGVYASDHWQKFYLSVRDFAAQYKGDDYNMYIKASLPDGTNSGTVLIDNVQLVYFD